MLTAPSAIGLFATGAISAAAGVGCGYQWYQGYQTGDRGIKLAKRPLVKALDCCQAVGGWLLSVYGNTYEENRESTTTKEVVFNKDRNVEENGAGEADSFIQPQNAEEVLD